MHAPRTTTRFVFPLVLTLGGAAAADEIGKPMRGLAADEVQRFTAGQTAFDTVEDAADGLGPVFNGTSCGGCHAGGAPGGGGDTIETRFGKITNGAFDPLISEGGPLIQTTGIGAAGSCSFTGEVVPPDATIVAGRRTTPLFGLGLVEAVPDATLLALANREALRHPMTAGRANMVTDVATGKTAVGRFGWKCQVATLTAFSADAYVNEMGITTPLFPDENCPQGDCSLLACDPVPGTDDADLGDVAAFADFMRMLAPPTHTRLASRSFGTSWNASRLLDQVGCTSCHVRSLTTGRSSVAPLQSRTFQPYSDFLLHDMGSLGDGIVQGGANGPEMRTAPLWGLRYVTTFLHDGRAHSIEEAILAHDGQGAAAHDRFARLPADAKASLLAYLRTF